MHNVHMRIDQYIASNGLTLEKFGDLVGVNHTTVSRWVRGVSFPSSRVMRVIAEKTGGAVQPNDFYDAPKNPGSDAA